MNTKRVTDSWKCWKINFTHKLLVNWAEIITYYTLRQRWAVPVYLCEVSERSSGWDHPWAWICLDVNAEHKSIGNMTQYENIQRLHTISACVRFYLSNWVNRHWSNLSEVAITKPTDSLKNHTDRCCVKRVNSVLPHVFTASVLCCSARHWN